MKSIASASATKRTAIERCHDRLKSMIIRGTTGNTVHAPMLPPGVDNNSFPFGREMGVVPVAIGDRIAGNPQMLPPHIEHFPHKPTSQVSATGNAVPDNAVNSLSHHLPIPIPEHHQSSTANLAAKNTAEVNETTQCTVNNAKMLQRNTLLYLQSAVVVM